MWHHAETQDIIFLDLLGHWRNCSSLGAPTWHPRCQPLSKGKSRIDGCSSHQRISLLSLLVLIWGQRTLTGPSAENLEKTEEHRSVYFGTQKQAAITRHLQEHQQQSSWSSCTSVWQPLPFTQDRAAFTTSFDTTTMAKCRRPNLNNTSPLRLAEHNLEVLHHLTSFISWYTFNTHPC